ncbi:centrosomal protein of 128 kDa isoform X19 [Loxodonta africana]|uniref:centrosomal protein of 128 kDa isoform X19 n=1 Tax=Loxodonta africana TaxID=9785 RepID=UPI000C811306|nr:centrosomal protein of 128 kDa isoform X11 [Loxodonta africana]
MAESSSDSDCFRHQDQLSRWATRSTHRGTQNHPTVDVTKKVNTITSTLQDTSRNLRQVDQMLGHYREYSNEQAGAIEQLKESLEQSIGQLRNRRLLRNSGGRSISVTSLSPSDLDGGAAAESHRFPPTSPLKDYGDPQGSKPMKSRPAGVRFVRENDDLGQLHILHQSLRDLSSEQVRLGDDLNREFSRRSRSDAETKRALEELTEKLNVQRQEVISDRVERRLQEIEREMRTERELVEKRQDQLGLMSLQLQEALKKQEAKADENEDVMKNKLRQTEAEKSQLEQELELSRRLLNQSEGSRETLMYQIEELRTQLMKAEGDRKGLQHQVSQISKQQSNHQDEQADDWRFRRGIEREKQGLEKQMSDVRAELNFNAMASELEEVKRCMERKDKEKAHLAVEVEAESLEDKNTAKVHLWQLEKLKSQCDRLTQELAQNEEENKKLKLKYQCLKEQLEEKEKHISNEEENLRRMEEARLQLKDQLLCLETEQESIFGMIGKEIDTACKTFWRDSVEKLKVFSSVPDIHFDPHRWLAESKTKLQWLCEELKERESREKSLRHQLMLCRQQLKDMTENKECELQYLFEQIERQEQLLEEIHREKRDLLDENHRKDAEVESLQPKLLFKIPPWEDASHTAVKNQSEAQFEEKADRVIALETSTRVALDHLESVPEKLSLLEDFKDFRESCGLSERPDGSYSKYKMQRDSPRLHRDDAKYRIKSFQDDGSHVHGLDHSSSWQDHSSFLSSPRFSHLNSFTKRAASVDSASIKEDPTSLTMNGKSLQSKKEESENKKSKIKTTNS